MHLTCVHTIYQSTFQKTHDIKGLILHCWTLLCNLFIMIKCTLLNNIMQSFLGLKCLMTRGYIVHNYHKRCHKAVKISTWWSWYWVEMQDRCQDNWFVAQPNTQTYDSCFFYLQLIISDRKQSQLNKIPQAAVKCGKIKNT